MCDKLKIAHIQLLPLLTGVQRVTLDELERLDLNKFERYIICKESGRLTEEASKKGIKCIYNRFLKREISLIYDVLALFYLYRTFRKHRFDIVHTHSSKTGVIGRIAAKLAGVRMIVHTVHGFAFPSAKTRFEKYIFFIMEWLGTKCSNKIICLHECDKEIAINKLGAKLKQIEVVANGVDITKYSPSSSLNKNMLRDEFNIPREVVCVGMVGRLWEQKNPSLLVSAAIKILSYGVDSHFIFIGDGELRTKLESEVRESGYSKKIHFLGWRDDTANLLNILDIFVLPSLWEGMPLAILEAQAKGLPCVVSNIQGNNHLVNDSYNGLLFELSKPDMLSDKILFLINDSCKRLELGKNAREKVLLEYDIDTRIKVISNIYLVFFSVN